MSHTLIRQVAQRIINMYEAAKPSMPDNKELYGAAVELVDLVEDLPTADVAAPQPAAAPEAEVGEVSDPATAPDTAAVGTESSPATSAPPAEGPPEGAAE